MTNRKRWVIIGLTLYALGITTGLIIAEIMVVMNHA